MAKLIWSARALADLDAACEYIARDSPRYAYLFAERIVKKIETIPRYPWLGAVVPEYGRKEIRERLFQNYRIVYRVRGDGDSVEIAAIVHGARLMPPPPPI
jgi:plasmid stabilization system protein ParE